MSGASKPGKCHYCSAEYSTAEELVRHLGTVGDHLRDRLLRAQAAVVRYAVAQGPHLSDSWKDFLVQECELVVDEGNPYRHPKVPTT
jgi:hypothetical protein